MRYIMLYMCGHENITFARLAGFISDTKMPKVGTRFWQLVIKKLPRSTSQTYTRISSRDAWCTSKTTR